ncbi:transglycosylase [Lecanora helva]
MRSQTLITAAIVASWAATPVVAQTYTNCNPLTSGSCPPNTALGKDVSIDFTQGASDSFTTQGSPSYDSNGASFTVAKSGDSPLIASKWYIMFGHVEFVVKAAPGVGIVSSAILQSDDLDEIDFEWLGYDDGNVQTNFFGKGDTTSYNRGSSVPASGNHDSFHTYAIDWTANQIVWSVNGKTVRTLTPQSTNGYPYPQTPMMIKIGSWSGGDPSNPQGTVEWATGGTGKTTDYSSGPYTMQVKSIAVTDYSTGSQYKYSGTDGTWQSITAVGGKVNSDGNGKAVQAAVSPAATGDSNSPMPFQGTHSAKESSVVQPNAGGWTPTTLQTSPAATVTTYPGLPAGWTVTSSGKVVPPSAAPVTSPPVSPTSSPADLQQGSPADGGYEAITSYDQQGFPVVVTQPVGGASDAKHYDDKGFLITTTAAALDPRSSPEAVPDNSMISPVQAMAASASSATPEVSKVSMASHISSGLKNVVLLFSGLSCVLGVVVLM